ncbi:MAG: hypothetical protein GEU80_11880 [Dehalococcoidia bacterium]|nr:hypothetical protein [Dehalococcoidia bacterium]
MDSLSTRAFVSGCILDLAGLGVSLQTPDEVRAEAVAHLLDGADLHPGAATIEVTWQDGPLPVPDRPSDHPFPGLGLWHTDEGVALRHGVLTGFAADNGLRIGGGADGRGEESPLWLDFRRIFEPAMTYLQAAHGRYMLHGAAMARGGRALVVVGSTGAGKSTLAWSAHVSGWELLADDYVFVRIAEDGGFEVCGMRKPVAVPGELMESPPPGARHLERGGRERWELSADILGRGWHRVAAVLRPAHGDGEQSELIPLQKSGLLTEVVAAFLASGDQVLLRQWFPHAAALSRLPGWELRHARPREHRVAEAARSLDAALASA